MTDAIVSINQLISRYSHRLDRGEAAEVAVLFSDDARLQPTFDGPYELRGRAEILDWVQHYISILRPSVRQLRHLVSTSELDARGDQATGVSYFSASAISNADGTLSHGDGTYWDRFVKVDGVWLFAERRIEIGFMAANTQVVERSPALGYTGGHKL